VLQDTLDPQPRDWSRYARQAAEFHVKNARAWASAATGEDLAAQVAPGFTLGRTPCEVDVTVTARAGEAPGVRPPCGSIVVDRLTAAGAYFRLEPAGRPMRPPPPAHPIRRNRRANVLMPPGVTALPSRDPPASYRL
jgi:hypothetical protein